MGGKGFSDGQTESSRDESRLDLQFQALLYVTGEMSADSARAFEQRLENDLAAAETVASTVQLLESIAAAEHGWIPAGRGVSLWQDRRRWALRFVAVAACAASLFLAIQRSWELSTPSSVSPMPAESIQNVALVWAETRKEISADLAYEEVLERVDLSEISEEDLQGTGDDWEASQLIGQNAWIIDAVGAMQANGPAVKSPQDPAQ